MVPIPEPNPRNFLRQFTRSYVNFFRQWSGGREVPNGVRLVVPESVPLDEDTLPTTLRELVAGYRKEHPDESVQVLKYMRSANGRPVIVVDDGSGLPDEGHLLTLSATTTMNSAEEVQVFTDQCVARRRQRQHERAG